MVFLSLVFKLREFTTRYSQFAASLQKRHRRELSSSQLAVVALKIEKRFAIEAEKRMKAGVKAEDNPESILTQGKAAEKTAAELNISATYVKAAKQLEKDAPDLLEKVRIGEINLLFNLRFVMIFVCRNPTENT